jgi:hypothetical protein
VTDVTAAAIDAVDEELVRQLTERARAEGLQLTGEGGLLQKLTKLVMESALDGELDDHLGYGKHDPAGRDGGNSRNGRRSKTLLTQAGPVEISVPRDRDASFEPRIVAKRQRRLTGVDDLVISLSAKGLTHGEIAAHLAEVYGAEVSKQTISTITDRVLEGMGEWQNRPLDPVYPVIFIDCVNVKIRDGQVANRPIYVALAVTVVLARTSGGKLVRARQTVPASAQAAAVILVARCRVRDGASRVSGLPAEVLVLQFAGDAGLVAAAAGGVGRRSVIWPIPAYSRTSLIPATADGLSGKERETAIIYRPPRIQDLFSISQPSSSASMARTSPLPKAFKPCRGNIPPHHRAGRSPVGLG